MPSIPSLIRRVYAAETLPELEEASAHLLAAGFIESNDFGEYYIAHALLEDGIKNDDLDLTIWGHYELSQFLRQVLRESRNSNEGSSQ